MSDTPAMITNVWPVDEFGKIKVDVPKRMCEGCKKPIYGTLKREHPELCWDCWREKYPKGIDQYCNNDVKLPPRKREK